ncbi:MAG: hypothetical protein IRZ11_08210, partial [Clostridia bacterium]|nr:hypothetical protein [Clostridia bacterium]
ARVGEAARRIAKRIDEIEAGLVQVRWKTPNDDLQWAAGLNAQIAYLAGLAAASDHRPTRAMKERFAELREEAEGRLAEWRRLAEAELPPFEELLRELGVPALARG